MRKLTPKEYKENFKFMRGAWKLAQIGDCGEAQYGAIIVGENKDILGLGFNHVVLGDYKCEDCPRRSTDFHGGVGLELCYATHAEEMALRNAYTIRYPKQDISLSDSVMYIGKIKDGEIKATRGKPHCTSCAKQIKNSGIEEVVFWDRKGDLIAFSSDEFLEESFKNLVGNYEKAGLKR